MHFTNRSEKCYRDSAEPKAGAAGAPEDPPVSVDCGGTGVRRLNLPRISVERMRAAIRVIEDWEALISRPVNYWRLCVHC